MKFNLGVLLCMWLSFITTLKAQITNCPADGTLATEVFQTLSPSAAGNCLLKTTGTDKIFLTFESVEVPADSNGACGNGEKITIAFTENGINPSPNPVCMGKVPPYGIISTGIYLHLKLESAAGKSYVAKFIKVTPATADATLTASSDLKVFQSSASTTINAVAGNTITLAFTEVLVTDAGNSPECQPTDKIEVFTKTSPTNSDQPLATVCKNKVPADVLNSTTGVFFLKYTATGSETYTATYKQTPPECKPSPPEATSSDADWSAPDQNGSANCGYKITAPEGSKVALTLKTISIPEIAGCGTENFVEFHDGMDNKAKSLGKFCGTKVPENNTFESSGTTLFVQLAMAGASQENMGITATYKTASASKWLPYSMFLLFPVFLSVTM